MASTNWRRLDREHTKTVLESVTSVAEPGLFNPTSCEVESALLPFYKSYRLYKVTNFASLPSFTFKYLGDGAYFHFLDSTPDPVLAVNDKGELNLDDRNILDYLSFYFENVSLDDGEECYFIHDPRDMPLFDSLDEETERAIRANHESPIVNFDQENGRYIVTAALYMEGQVNRATIHIRKQSGRVRITEQKMIWNEIMDYDLESIT